jgi:hypothetical protein
MIQIEIPDGWYCSTRKLRCPCLGLDGAGRCCCGLFNDIVGMDSNLKVFKNKKCVDTFKKNR